MSKKERFVSCFDVGTQKICVVVARTGADGQAEIVGSGTAPSNGIVRGVVVDMEQLSDALRRAGQEIEAGSDLSIDWVTVSISGDHIQGFNCHGAIPIEGRNNEVTVQDVVQVVAAAQSIPLPPTREIVHVLPQEYVLDTRGGIRQPVGLTGSRLEVDLHVVTSDSAQMQNLVNAVNRAQMRVRKVICKHIASAEAVLTRDEKELGAVVMDIGAGTTDVALVVRHGVRYTGTLPVAGAHFTRDLAVGLRTPIDEAERIKRESGSALYEDVAEDDMIEVPGVGSRSPRPMPRRFACEILHHRAVELLELVREQIDRAGAAEQALAGVVVTGGGSMLHGLMEIAERVLGMPARRGVPQGLRGLTEQLAHPACATAAGLAMLSCQEGHLHPARDARGAAPPWLVNRFLSWVGS